MYKLAYGSPPFEAFPGKLAALIVSGVRPKRPATGVSRGLSLFIDKCLQHDIKQRYQTAAHALNGLIRCKELFEMEQRGRPSVKSGENDAAPRARAEDANAQHQNDAMQHVLKQIIEKTEAAKARNAEFERQLQHQMLHQPVDADTDRDREQEQKSHYMNSNGTPVANINTNRNASKSTPPEAAPVMPRMAGLAQLARAGFTLQPMVEAKTPTRTRMRGPAMRGLDQDLYSGAIQPASDESSNDESDHLNGRRAPPPRPPKGSVGIIITRDYPHTVLRLAGLRDEAGRLQGDAGYANEEVLKGDVLVKVNGVSVEKAPIEEVREGASALS